MSHMLRHLTRRFSMSRPVATHFRAATCEEVSCPHYLFGWQTVVPEGGPMAQQIRNMKWLRHREEHRDAGLVTFVFEAGQNCFRQLTGQHKLPLERSPLYLDQKGDDAIRRYAKADEFMYAYNEHADRINQGRR